MGIWAWFVYIDGQLIGWYQSAAFTGQMQWSATYLQVGGEVFDHWAGGQHTTTQMGSGIYPSGPPPYYGYGYSAYHRNVSYIDSGFPVNGSDYHKSSLAYTTSPPPAEGDLGYPGICGFDAGTYGYGLSLTPQSGQQNSICFCFGGDEIS